VLERGYTTVNIKLDKTGGLTEAQALAEEAKRMGFDVMVGCMSGTTLAMAPGYLVAQHCRYVDLDSPIYLPPEAAPRSNTKVLRSPGRRPEAGVRRSSRPRQRTASV
jgi:L-alanine-DL-glutamate epimerase-like enolase superfamily enzyme